MAPTLAELKARLAALEIRVKKMEDSEAHKLAIVRHMQKHRIQGYLRNKLGNQHG